MKFCAAEATFVQSTRTQRFLKKHLNPAILVFIGRHGVNTYVNIAVSVTMIGNTLLEMICIC